MQPLQLLGHDLGGTHQIATLSSERPKYEKNYSQDSKIFAIMHISGPNELF